MALPSVQATSIHTSLWNVGESSPVLLEASLTVGLLLGSCFLAMRPWLKDEEGNNIKSKQVSMSRETWFVRRIWSAVILLSLLARLLISPDRVYELPFLLALALATTGMHDHVYSMFIFDSLAALHWYGVVTEVLAALLISRDTRSLLTEIGMVLPACLTASSPIFRAKQPCIQPVFWRDMLPFACLLFGQLVTSLVLNLWPYLGEEKVILDDQHTPQWIMSSCPTSVHRASTSLLWLLCHVLGMLVTSYCIHDEKAQPVPVISPVELPLAGSKAGRTGGRSPPTKDRYANLLHDTARSRRDWANDSSIITEEDAMLHKGSASKGSCENLDASANATAHEIPGDSVEITEEEAIRIIESRLLSVKKKRADGNS